MSGSKLRPSWRSSRFRCPRSACCPLFPPPRAVKHVVRPVSHDPVPAQILGTTAVRRRGPTTVGAVRRSTTRGYVAWADGRAGAAHGGAGAGGERLRRRGDDPGAVGRARRHRARHRAPPRAPPSRDRGRPSEPNRRRPSSRPAASSSRSGRIRVTAPGRSGGSPTTRRSPMTASGRSAAGSSGGAAPRRHRPRRGGARAGDAERSWQPGRSRRAFEEQHEHGAGRAQPAFYYTAEANTFLTEHVMGLWDSGYIDRAQHLACPTPSRRSASRRSSTRSPRPTDSPGS